jgi:hypothetical protein
MTVTRLRALIFDNDENNIVALIDGCGSRGVTAEPVWSARCAGM